MFMHVRSVVFCMCVIDMSENMHVVLLFNIDYGAMLFSDIRALRFSVSQVSLFFKLDIRADMLFTSHFASIYEGFFPVGCI
jgi:hypothetical protein